MAGGPLTGKFDAVSLIGFGAGDFDMPTYDGGLVLLRVTEALAPVPEPETYALMLSGIGFVVWAVGRQRRRMPAAR